MNPNGAWKSPLLKMGELTHAPTQVASQPLADGSRVAVIACAAMGCAGDLGSVRALAGEHLLHPNQRNLRHHRSRNAK